MCEIVEYIPGKVPGTILIHSVVRTRVTALSKPGKTGKPVTN